MVASAKLVVEKGPLAGKSYAFNERTSCIIGRAPECNILLPSDDAHGEISRHHCLLDINPPAVRIRDMGSLNGTFVNGVKIGQRKSQETPDQAAQHAFPEHDLKDGDRIELGGTTFSLSVVRPVVCAACSAELPGTPPGQAGKELLCKACKERARRDPVAPGGKEYPISKIIRKKCPVCGKVLSVGEGICNACRNNPQDLVMAILGMAVGKQAAPPSVAGFKVVKELGRGGNGAVYLVEDPQRGERVALKIMLPSVASSPDAKARFLREMENARALKHPNVVEMYDSGCVDDVFYMTMEYCEKGSCDHYLRARGGKLPVDEALAITFQALDGLEYIHSAPVPHVALKDGRIAAANGLVHRDLKPGNLFFRPAGGGFTTKIADVGLAKAFDLAGLSGQTMTGMAAGTPHFVPRQQVINFKYSKPEVDVWAMAASLYSMLTGSPPRTFLRGEDVWRKILQTPAVPIQQHNPSIPAGLARVIDHALQDNPSIGFTTAGQLRDALKEAL